MNDFLCAIAQFGYKIDYFKKKRVIEILDFIIENNEYIKYEVIEASLLGSKNINDTILKLNDIIVSTSTHKVVKVLLGIMYNLLIQEKMTGSEVSYCTYKLLLLTKLFDEEDYYKLYTLDDEIYLAENKIYGDLKQLNIDLRNELQKYNKDFVDFKEMLVNNFGNKYNEIHDLLICN